MGRLPPISLHIAEFWFSANMSQYNLTDFEWRVIKPLLPNKPRGVRRVDDRRVLNGIFWVFRSGAPWRDLPERYGPRTTCYNRFVRWRKAGAWGRLMDAISTARDDTIQMIDSTSIRAHQQAATAKREGSDHCLGRSRGGLTTKIHVVVDAQGRPIRLGLTAGQANDGQIADTLLDHLGPRTIVVSFGLVRGSGVASGVNDRDVVSLFDRSCWLPDPIRGAPPPNFDFGGISGGIMLTVIQGTLRSWSLAGVVYEGPCTSDNPGEAIEGLEILRARRAHFLKPDGGLDTALWHALGGHDHVEP